MKWLNITRCFCRLEYTVAPYRYSHVKSATRKYMRRFVRVVRVVNIVDDPYESFESTKFIMARETLEW